MINYSDPYLLKIRKFCQTLGVLRPLVKVFRKLFNLSYEGSFDQQMMLGVSTNDVVWDIGANVGYFTTKFADKVGATGQVIAFEPTPRTYSSLLKNCITYQNIVCKNLALADKSGGLSFRDSGIENDPTNGLVEESTANAIKVEVVSADELIMAQSIPLPNIIKIDVEGYEYEVIKGMKATLNNRLLRNIFIEIHFLELNKRGLENAATEIVKTISDCGFSITWTDPSHFIASR